MKKFLIALTAALACTSLTALADEFPTSSSLKVFCDSLSSALQRRTGVQDVSLQIKKVLKAGEAADIYFDKSFSDLPWHREDLDWLRDTLQSEIGESPVIGTIFCNKYDAEQLCVPKLGNSGQYATEYLYRVKDPNPARRVMVETEGTRKFHKGLSGRHIAVWQSHGRYYDAGKGCWSWQRAPLFRTVEDMYTQSYVLPFLIPMLENAGAYVLTPRERDSQPLEIICDNDPDFGTSRDFRGRTHGTYLEEGIWSSGTPGFADSLEHYCFGQNPFRMGSVRKATVCQGEPTSIAMWTPVVAERGEYAVYVSYTSFPNSSNAALYTVHHNGGKTSFIVNQKRGGGTWIYLGTFEFREGTGGFVSLDNTIPEGRTVAANSIVCADAVKFGGGMGKTLRGPEDRPLEEWSTSGLPAFAEGASYWMNWAGADTAAVRKWDNDYVNDYAGRGMWVKYMREEKKVPFDLSLAFHTDAGVTPDSSTVGTLAIYSLKSENKREFPDGTDRMQSRMLAELVQDQLVSDIRTSYEPQWSRRGLWDRNYSESRRPELPAMILELLSHQNFSDMQYGLDPGFRFTVSRAVYKGILKFLSELYGCSYKVQPLPVCNLSATFSSPKEIRLSWKPVTDSLEPTSAPEGYTVYTRTDDLGFDSGRETADTCLVIPIEPGHLYSFRVDAFNSGGRSFPSEILSAGLPATETTDTVLIVNNFTRISGPVFTDREDYGLFDDRRDSGVPWGKDISFTGEMYETDRSLPWNSNDDSGFGASWVDKAGNIVAGNSFDYCSVHGRAILKSGRAFCSQSAAAFAASRDSLSGRVIDLICGKQTSTRTGRQTEKIRFQIFPAEMRSRLRLLTSLGCNVLISGSEIASEAWRPEYGEVRDSLETAELQAFITEVLGYRFASAHASHTGKVNGMEFHNSPNPSCYCVENPDGLLPAPSKGKTVLRYSDSGCGAAVCYNADGWKVFAAGFPIECLKDSADINKVIGKALDYLANYSLKEDGLNK